MSKAVSITMTFNTADAKRGGGEVSSVFTGLRGEAQRAGREITKALTVSTAGLTRGLRDVEAVLKRINDLAQNGKLQQALKAAESVSRAQLAAARATEREQQRLAQEQIKRAAKVADAEAREAARMAREKERSARSAARDEAKAAEAAAREQTRIRTAEMQAAARIEQEKVKAAAAAERQKVQLTAQAERDRTRAQERATREAQQAQRSAASAPTRLQTTQGKLDTVGRGLATAGAGLTATVTAPLAVFAKFALDVGTKYDAAMNMLQVATDATAEQMQRAAQKAIELGADMSLPATSAANAAEAMVELGKAGMNVEQAMAASKGVLQLAAAAHISEAQAAEINANALNSFGLAASESTRVADLLAAGANASSAEITDMAQAMQQSSAVFAGAKVPIEDLTTLIGLMANAGIKGSDAGTSLKTMLMRLQAPTKEAKSVLDKMNVSVFDGEHRLKSFRQLISEMSVPLKQMNDEQRAQALSTVFGADAMRAATVIFGKGTEAYDKMKAAVTKQGAAADVAAARTKGLGGAWEGLQSQVETLALLVYEQFKGPLETAVRSVAEWVGQLTEKFNALAQAHPGLVRLAGVVAAVAAAVGPLLLVLGGVAIFAGQVVSAVSTLAVMFGGAEAAAGGFTAALGVIAAPLLEIVAVIAAVVAAVIVLYEAWSHNFGGLRDLTNEVMAAVQSGIAAALQFIQELWARYGGGIMRAARAVWQGVLSVVTAAVTAIVSFIRENFQIIVEWVKENWPLIKQIIVAVLDSIYAQVQLVLLAVRAFWQQHGEQIMAIVSAAWSVIRTVIQTALRNVLDVIRIALQLLTGDWAGAWNTLIRISERMNQALFAVLRGLATIVLNVLKFVVTTIWGQALEWLKAGIGLAQSLVEGIVTTLTGSTVMGRIASAALGLVLGLGLTAQNAAAQQGAAAGHAFANNMRAAMAQGTAPGHGAGGVPTGTGVQIAVAHGHEFPQSKAREAATKNPFAGVDFSKAGQRAGGGGGGNKATRAADQAATAAMKQAEIDLQAAERIARAATATAQREYDARQISLAEFVQKQIDTENTLAAAKLAALKVEKTEAEKLSKGTERTTKLKEIAEKEAQINSDLAQRTAEINARRDQVELEAQRAHAQALLDLEEEYDRRDLARIAERADRGLISAEQEAQQRAAVEAAAYTRRLAALEDDLKAAGANAQEHARIVDEINKVTASKATAEEEAARRSAAARRKDLADAQKFAEQLRALQDENDKFAAEIGDRRLEREAQRGADPRYIEAQRAARDRDAENRYHAQQAREIEAARQAVERSQQTEEQKAALRRVYDEREQLEAVRHADAMQEILDRPLTAYRHKLEEIAQSITGIFDKALDQLFEHGFKGFFTSVVQGFKDMLKQMLKDFILSGIQQVLRNIISVVTGGARPGVNAGNTSGGGLLGRILRGVGSIFFPGLGGAGGGSNAGIFGGGQQSGDGVFTVPGGSAFAGGGGGALSFGALALNLLSGGRLFGGNSSGAPTLTGAINERVNNFSMIRALAGGGVTGGGGIFGGGAAAGAQAGRFGQLALLAPFLGAQLGVGLGGRSGLGRVLGGIGGGLLGGAALAALAPGVLTGLFGGATASVFGGAFGLGGAAVGFLTNPFTIGIGAALLVGALIAGRNAQRRHDETLRDGYATDARAAVLRLIQQVNNDEIDGAQALAAVAQIRSNYTAQAMQLKDRKARDHALLWLQNDFPQVVEYLNQAIKEQETRQKQGARRKPEFAEGGPVPGPLGSRQHIVAHGGEVIANLDQQAQLGRALLAMAGVPGLGGAGALLPHITTPQAYGAAGGAAGAGGDIVIDELWIDIDAEGIFVRGGRSRDGRRLIIETTREYKQEGS